MKINEEKTAPGSKMKARIGEWKQKRREDKK
jgi:hypothetical protein